MCLKDLDIGFIKWNKNSPNTLGKDLGVRSSLQTLLCHILTSHHWITVKMGGREQMVWQGGGCVSIMYLLGSLLSLAKYMSRNHSPRSAWRCCVKLRWELEDGKEKKEKEGQKWQRGYVWHSRKCTCAVAGIGVVLGRQISPFVNIYCSVFAMFMTLDIQLRPKCRPHTVNN